MMNCYRSKLLDAGGVAQRRGREKIDTDLGGSVVEADGDHTVRRIPNGTVGAAGARASAIARANRLVLAVGAIRVRRVAIDERGLGHVRDLARGNRRVERVRPSSRQVARVRRTLRVKRGPG